MRHVLTSNEGNSAMYSQDSLNVPIVNNDTSKVAAACDCDDELKVSIIRGSDDKSIQTTASYDNEFGDVKNVRKQLMRSSKADNRVLDELQIDPVIWSSIASDGDLDEYASKLLAQCDKLLQSYDENNILQDAARPRLSLAEPAQSVEAILDVKNPKVSIESGASNFYCSVASSDENVKSSLIPVVGQHDDNESTYSSYSVDTSANQQRERLSKSAFVSDHSRSIDVAISFNSDDLGMSEGHVYHDFNEEELPVFDENEIKQYLDDPYVKLLWEKLSATLAQIKKQEQSSAVAVL